MTGGSENCKTYEIILSNILYQVILFFQSKKLNENFQLHEKIKMHMQMWNELIVFSDLFVVSRISHLLFS